MGVRLMIGLFIALIGGMFYYNHSQREAAQAKEIARLQLEKEEMALRQLELKREIEQEKERLARIEKEDLERARQLEQYRAESQRHSAELAANEARGNRERRQPYNQDPFVRDRHIKPASGPIIQVR